MEHGFGSAPRALVAAAAAAIAFAGTAQAQTLTMATDKVGTTFNAIGAGMAKTVTEESNLRIVVKPFAGPDAYLPALERGEVNLATLSSSSAYVSYEGHNKAKKKYQAMRILRSGEGGVRLTFVVPAKSSVHSIKDLKGKRVAAGFGGHATIPKSIEGALRTAGLNWKDVVQVPVTGAADSVQALGAGRVDASWSSYGMPVTREVHAKMGIRYLPIEPGANSLKILREAIFPGVQLVTTKADPKNGLPKDAHMISYDSYLVTHKGQDDKSVRLMLEALWKATDKLTKVHRGLAGFTHKTAVTDIPVVPYHPAAIAFYKEKGVWTAEAQAANAKLTN